MRLKEKSGNLKVAFIIFLIVSLVLQGCAHTPHYTLGNVLKSESPVHAMKIAVAPFVDERPKRERKVFKIREEGLSAMIVKHFKHVKLFARQELLGIEFARPTSEHLVQLKTNGYDAILIGSITAYGGSSGKKLFDRKPALGLPFLLMIPIVTFPLLFVVVFTTVVEKVPHKGYTNLTAELIETSSGCIIWKGGVWEMPPDGLVPHPEL